MKPQDLKIPFSFDTREVTFEKGVLFIPDHLDTYGSETLDKWVQGPIVIELCSGNGHWVAQQAKEHTDKTFIAVEKRFDRVQKIWSKKQNEGLDNLLIIWGKAEIALKYFCAEKSIDELYIHFPDPWPKNRHRKHRLFQASFLKDVKKAMKEKGSLTLVTDHKIYGLNAYEAMQASGFDSLIKKPGYKVLKSYSNSTFEELFRSFGQKIYSFIFEVPSA